MDIDRVLYLIMPSRSKPVIDLDAAVERLKNPRNMKGANGRKIPRALAKSVAKTTAQGIRQRERVYQLIVEQRYSHAEVAEVLGVTVTRVGQLWRDIMESLIARVPKTPDDFVMMRAQVNGHLDQIIQDACVLRHDARNQAIRLKALEMKCRLFGLNLEGSDSLGEEKPYAPPEEIAADVEKMQLAIFGRGKDVEAAKLALQEGERDVSPSTTSNHSEDHAAA